MAPYICFIRSHMSEPHTTTAPSSIVLLLSGTRAARFTVRAMPIPLQVGHAPSLLKASYSAPGPKNSVPQWGAVCWRLGRHVKGGRDVLAAVGAHVAAHAREQKAQAVQQLA